MPISFRPTKANIPPSACTDCIHFRVAGDGVRLDTGEPGRKGSRPSRSLRSGGPPVSYYSGVQGWGMETMVSKAVEALGEARDEGYGMLFTGGKDSMVMLHLARDRLDWTPDLFVIDTGNQFDALYDFREELAEDWGLAYDVRRNDEFIVKVIENDEDDRGYAWDGPKTEGCCGALKIDVIGDIIADGNDKLLVGRRSADVGHDLPVHDPDYREPVPHDRIHPLANWTDAHISAYITKHRVPLPPMYERGYDHTDCVDCCQAGEDGDDWSGASAEKRQQLNDLRDMGYM